jgi:hypothetical protein
MSFYIKVSRTRVLTRQYICNATYGYDVVFSSKPFSSLGFWVSFNETCAYLSTQGIIKHTYSNLKGNEEEEKS